MRPILLASTSRYRRMLLARLRFPFDSAAPHYEERTDPDADAEELVSEHALGKARSLAEAHPESLIIGSDQVVSLDGRILGKPGTHARAVEQLRAMRGRQHVLLTAVVVLDASTGETVSHVERTTLRLRDLSDAQLETYVRTEEPLDCAGAYKSELLGIALFEYLRGDDPTAIIGLPLTAVVRLLAHFGFDVLDDAIIRDR